MHTYESADAVPVDARWFGVVSMRAGTEIVERSGLTHAEATRLAREIRDAGKVTAVVRVRDGKPSRSSDRGLSR